MIKKIKNSRNKNLRIPTVLRAQSMIPKYVRKEGNIFHIVDNKLQFFPEIIKPSQFLFTFICDVFFIAQMVISASVFLAKHSTRNIKATSDR